MAGVMTQPDCANHRWSWATASYPQSTASSSAPSSCPIRAFTTAWPPRTASSAQSPRSACECWARPWWACWQTNSSRRGHGPARCTLRSYWQPSVQQRAWQYNSTAKKGRSSKTSSRGSSNHNRLDLSGGTWPNWSPCWTGGRAATAAITSQRSEMGGKDWRARLPLFLYPDPHFPTLISNCRAAPWTRSKTRRWVRGVVYSAVSLFLAWGTVTRWLWHTLTHTHRHPQAVHHKPKWPCYECPRISSSLSWYCLW